MKKLKTLIADILALKGFSSKRKPLALSLDNRRHKVDGFL
jgi:hypothetical protein